MNMTLAQSSRKEDQYPTDKWSKAVKHQKSYSRIQALWRGYIDRRKMNVLIRNDLQMSIKYFNFQETKETIKSVRLNVSSIRRAQNVKKQVYHYSNSAIYDGYWLGGFRHGFGSMKWADGASYKGNWSFGKAYGHGVFSFPDGEQYEGAWTCDKTLDPITELKMKKNGYMWLINKDKQKMVTNAPTSDGQVTSVKVAKIKSDIRSVKQKLKHPEQLKKLSQESMQGREQREVVSENGDRYVGTFLNGNRDGIGQKTWANGDVFDGEWKDNMQHGWGVSNWTDGSSYKGLFIQNMKEGIGHYIWEDQNTFIGEWKKNLMQGLGRYKWPDGRSYTGYWNQGMMHGLGIFKWPDGKRYEGFWSLGKKNGEGVTIYSDGRKSLDIWSNGNKTKVK